MPRRVKGPDGIVRVFPDDATDDEIRSALEAAQPARPMSQPAAQPTERELMLMEQGLSVDPKVPIATDLVVGAAKGAVDTISRIADLTVRKVPGAAALDRFAPPMRVNVEPTNTTQRIGKTVERIAEVAAPSRAIASAGLTLASKAAPALSRAVGQTAAQVAPRVAVEAAAGAGLSAMQGGDPTIGAVLAGAVPVAGRAAAVLPQRLRESASKQVEQALGATKERFKAMAERLTPQILARGLRGSRESLKAQAAERVEDVGDQIDTAIEQFGARQVGTQPVVDALEHAKDAFRTVSRQPMQAVEDAPAMFIGRTTATPDQVWFKALSDAKKQGYKGSVGELREVFLERLDQAKNLQGDLAASEAEYGHEAFLSAIRKLGGLKPFSKERGQKKMRGDFATIVEGFGAKSTWAQKGGGSIFRNKGLALDDMVDQLRQDPRWKALITDERDLLNVLDDLARQGPTKAADEGIEHYLSAAGVRPGVAWWKDAGARVVEFEPRSIRQLDGLQRIIKDLGETARVDQLVAVRRAWDNVVDQAGGYSHRAAGAIGVPLKDSAEAWAKREGAGAIRRLLDDEVPELTKINKEYHFWKSLNDVLRQTLKRTQPQGTGLGSDIAEASGRAVGAVQGGVGTAFVLGRMSRMALNVFRSPRYRLASAQAKDRLADAIMNGNASEVAGALSRIGAVQAAGVGR